MDVLVFFFFKQKTAYELRISDWSSDVCSSDLGTIVQPDDGPVGDRGAQQHHGQRAIRTEIVHKASESGQQTVVFDAQHGACTGCGWEGRSLDRKSVV